MSEVKKCSFILIRGVNQGLPCGRKITETNNEYCKLHIDLENKCGCEFILTRGDKKGKKCNKPIKHKNLCYVHSNEVEYKKCPFIIIRGNRKGQVCDRRCKKNANFCTIHITRD